MSVYSLATSYVGNALISGFNWINTADPTGGFVAYVRYHRPALVLASSLTPFTATDTKVNKMPSRGGFTR